MRQRMTGRVLLVGRLAARDLRYRPVQALLLLVVIAAAMSALTLGLLVHGVSIGPYDQTRMATRGPDVTASSVGFPAGPRGPFAQLADARGVTAHSGPFPVAWPVLRANGTTAAVMAEGRDAAPAAVDQPAVTAGNWVRPGGVVLERAFADAIGIGVGDRVALDGRSFQVTGIARRDPGRRSLLTRAPRSHGLKNRWPRAAAGRCPAPAGTPR